MGVQGEGEKGGWPGGSSLGLGGCWCRRAQCRYPFRVVCWRAWNLGVEFDRGDGRFADRWPQSTTATTQWLGCKRE
jgi:hypothetical protein